MHKNDIKIGIDFHGVLANRPEYFIEFCRRVVQKGWELHIISGGPKVEIKEWLKKNDVFYTKLYTILEQCTKNNEVTFFEDGTFHVDDKIWNRAKGDYCKKENISLHIDDSKEYYPYFSTPFCLYDSCKKKCVIKNGVSIEFVPDFDAVISKIEDYLCNKS